MPFMYRGIEAGQRLPCRLSGRAEVVVEVKAIARIEPVHRAQVLSYLKQAGCKVGLLFNFNVRILLPDGFRRIVNGFPD
jgi:GxxExxY protein